MQEKYFFAGVTSCVCPFCNQWPNIKKRTDKKANLVHSFTGGFEDSPECATLFDPLSAAR